MSRQPGVGSDFGIWGTILNDYLSVAHNADGTLKLGGGGSGLFLNYNTVDNISGQNNLINQKIAPVSIGSNQQLGVWIDMTTTNILGAGGFFRIPLAMRVQSGGGTGAGTGEGMRGMNIIVQQNAADTQATMFMIEGAINNNKADVGANPPGSTVIGGYSAASLGSFPGTNAVSIDGTGRWWRGLRIAPQAIVVGGNAFDYGGDGTHGSVVISDASRMTIGNGVTVDPALIVNNGLQVTAGILRVGTTAVGSAASGTIVLANNKPLSAIQSGGSAVSELMRLSSADVVHINPSADRVVAIGVPGSTTGAVVGDHVIPNAKALRSANAAASGTIIIVDVNGADQVRIAPGGGDILWGRALVALGGGAAPTFGTIGGSGPATAAQNTWMRVLDSTGAAFWVPAWK